MLAESFSESDVYSPDPKLTGKAEGSPLRSFIQPPSYNHCCLVMLDFINILCPSCQSAFCYYNKETEIISFIGKIYCSCE